jgi:hypothetical protein
MWPEPLGLGALLHVLARVASRQPLGRHRWAILALLGICTSAVLAAGRVTGDASIGAVGVLGVFIILPLRC